MALFKPKEVNNYYNGIQKIYQFENGQGASVVKHDGSYGNKAGLWELAVLDAEGNLDYNTRITGDVIGHQTEEQIQVLLTEISEL